MSDETTMEHRASVVKPEWAEWCTNATRAIRPASDGPVKVNEGFAHKETHKLVASKAGSIREQYLTLEFTSSITLNCAQTTEDIINTKSIAREILLHEHLEWADNARYVMLDYARKRLLEGP